VTVEATRFVGCDAQRAPNREHRTESGSVSGADLARGVAGLRALARDQDDGTS
jgi:hypothetical protein